MQMSDLGTIIGIVGHNLLKYLDDNDCFDLCLVNKGVKNAIYGVGFLKELKHNGTDYMTFIKLFSVHRYTIKKTIFSRLINPDAWLIDNEVIHIDSCGFNSISPSVTLRKVKTLYFNFCNTFYGSEGRILMGNEPVINWSKFPNLEKVYIFGTAICLDGITSCKKLNTLVYNSMTNNWNWIPREIFELKHLKNLAFTCHIDDKGQTYENMNIVIGKTCMELPNIKFFCNKSITYGNYDDVKDDEIRQVRIKNIC